MISEREMEASIVRHLTRVGIPVQRQVRVRSGIIDLLTPAAMYEVKRLLTRVAMRQGLGQLLVYAREVTPTRHHRVLIAHHTGDIERLAPVFSALGVTVYSLRCHYASPIGPELIYEATPIARRAGLKTRKKAPAGAHRYAEHHQLWIPFEPT